MTNNFFLYIDPGSGSLLLQAIIAGALGIAVFFKQLKYKVLSFFGKEQGEQKQE